MEGGKQKNINECYAIFEDQLLGKGAFGKVYKGWSRRLNNIVAIKELHGNVEAIYKKTPNFQRQIHILKKTKHPGIVQLYDCIETDTNVYVVMEFCEGGELKKLLKENGAISEKKVLEFFRQIVDALAFVQNSSFLHRDIKPDNILLMKDDTIKIGDFGLAREVIGTDILKLQTYTHIGTPLYAAPNVLKGETFSGKCDVWSVGVTIAELLTGANMFADCKSFFGLQQAHERLKEEPFHLEGNYNPFWGEILPQMLAYDEKNRISFDKLQKILQTRAEEVLKELTKVGTVSGSGPKKPIRIVGRIKKELENTKDQFNIVNEEEKNYNLFLDSSRYMVYRFDRVSFCREIGNQVHKYRVYSNSLYNYVAVFLCQAIFTTGVAQLQQYVKVDPKKLPDSPSTVFNKKLLNEMNEKRTNDYFSQYLRGLDDEFKGYSDFLKQQIIMKMKYYGIESSPIYARYGFERLMNGVMADRYQSIQTYAGLLEKLLKSELRIEYSTSTHSSILMVFAFLVTLPSLLSVFPDKDYKNVDLINKFKENIEKKNSVQLSEQIDRFYSS